MERTYVTELFKTVKNLESLLDEIDGDEDYERSEAFEFLTQSISDEIETLYGYFRTYDYNLNIEKGETKE